MSQKSKLIQSVQRAIDILDCFDHDKKELSLSEISQALGLNQSTVHGILLTLQVNSYIEKDQEKAKYRLGTKLLEKGTIVLGGLDLRQIARPYMELLTNKFRETANLCIYQHNTLYVIDKHESVHSTFYMSSKIGLKIPLHSSASGKLVLAYLEEGQVNKILERINLDKYTANTMADLGVIEENLEKIRIQGYSVENEELESGLYTIAAPIFNHRNDIIGTISLLGPTLRMKENQDLIIQDITSYSKQISTAMGCRY